MTLSNFTCKYQMYKTLRFELKPVGDTEKFIREKGLPQQDKVRAKRYKKGYQNREGMINNGKSYNRFLSLLK